MKTIKNLKKGQEIGSHIHPISSYFKGYVTVISVGEKKTKVRGINKTTGKISTYEFGTKNIINNINK